MSHLRVTRSVLADDCCINLVLDRPAQAAASRYGSSTLTAAVLGFPVDDSVSKSTASSARPASSRAAASSRGGIGSVASWSSSAPSTCSGASATLAAW